MDRERGIIHQIRGMSMCNELECCSKDVADEQFQKAMQMSRQGAQQVWAAVREAAGEHVAKTVK